MADLELHQIQMKLTKDPEILAALRRKNQFQSDTGGEYISVQFNSQELKFRPGEIKTLNESVARSIHRRSWVNIGDDLTGETKGLFEIVAELDLGEALSGNKNICTVCRRAFDTPARLGKHLVETHADAEYVKPVETEVTTQEVKGATVTKGVRGFQKKVAPVIEDEEIADQKGDEVEVS